MPVGLAHFSELPWDAFEHGLWTVRIFSAALGLKRTSQAFLLHQLDGRFGCRAQQSQSSCYCEVKGAVPRHSAVSTALSRGAQGLVVQSSSSARSLQEDPCDQGVLSIGPAPREESWFSLGWHSVCKPAQHCKNDPASLCRGLHRLFCCLFWLLPDAFDL